jgi:molybdenum cofactor synthesis domain-containing protein
MLRDWSLERAGRVGKKNKNEKKSGENGDDVPKHQVTMSQTSSTVSLPDATTILTLSKHERSMSKVINMDDTPPATSSIDNKTSLPHPPSVALIVIGDELLKGMTSDANVLSAARALRSYNVPLARVSIISDDSQGIIDEIRRIRKEVDVVITSGGVGPTHDDVTVRSVAEALGLEIEMNYEMAKLLIDKMGNGEVIDGHEEGDEEDLFSRLPEGLRKMACIPSESTLRYLSIDSEKDEWPVLQCSNIFVLPGVPNYFQQQIEQLALHLSSLGTLAELPFNGSKLRRLPSAPLPPRSDTYRLVLSMDENSIVSELNATVQANPHVSFGSYPLVDHPTYKTIITLEGRFYNGGYTKNSERLLSRALSDCTLGIDDDLTSERSDKHCERRESVRQTLYFSKEEMDNNVKIALEDLQSRLPPESIIKVDTNDYLAVDQP